MFEGGAGRPAFCSRGSAASRGFPDSLDNAGNDSSLPKREQLPLTRVCLPTWRLSDKRQNCEEPSRNHSAQAHPFVVLSANHHQGDNDAHVETRLVLAARQEPSESDALRYVNKYTVDPIIIALLLLFLAGRWRSHNAVALAEPLQIRDGLQARQRPVPIELRLPGSTRRTWKDHVGVHELREL